MRTFFKFFLAVAVVVGTFFIFNYGVVFFSGEMRSYADVVAELKMDDKTVYGSVFNNDYSSYKREVYKDIQPEVLVLGSSRVLQYPQAYFNKRIANCGLAVSNVYMARQFIDMMLEKPLPHTVVLGLDYWWFIEDLNKVQDVVSLSTGSEVTYDKMFLPFGYWIQGKFKIANLINNRSAAGFSGNPAGNRIGLRAIEYDGGFSYDGSSRYGTNMIQPGDDIRLFKSVGMEHIAGQGTSYKFGADFKQGNLDEFLAAVQRLKDKGVEVIMFMPPVYTEFYDYVVSSGNYEYIFKLQNILRDIYGVHVYTDPGTLELSAEDFHDLIHTRRGAAAKLMLDLARKEPKLLRLVDVNELEEVIKADPRR